MNRTLVFFCFLFCLSIPAGCQNNRQQNRIDKANADNSAEFPGFLVGTWRADENGWEIVFESDGTISSAVISMSRTRIEPGRTTTIPMKKGGKGVFKSGQWLVNYDPNDRQLTVSITIDHFYMEIGDSTIDGNSTDIFAGNVAEDDKFWPATWTSFRNCKAHTAKHPDFDLSTEPDYGDAKQLVFEKVVKPNATK